MGELGEEWSKNFDENEMINNETLNAISLNVYKSNSCTLYITLFVLYLVTSFISSVFISFYWYLKRILQMLITSINEDY